MNTTFLSCGGFWVFGKVIVTVVPTPTTLDKDIDAPFCSSLYLAWYRPEPVPPKVLCVKPFLKRLGRCFLSIPFPLSWMTILISVSWFKTDNLILPVFSIALMELFKRFEIVEKKSVLLKDKIEISSRFSSSIKILFEVLANSSRLSSRMLSISLVRLIVSTLFCLVVSVSWRWDLTIATFDLISLTMYGDNSDSLLSM